MKNTLIKVFSLLLVLVFSLFLTACSKYSALEKAFKNKGYSVNETLAEQSKKIEEELKENDKDMVVKLHLLTKDGSLSSALIIEFNSTEDMVKAYEDSETIKGFVKDVKNNEDAQKVYEALQDSGYAKGNCLVIPLSIVPSTVSEIKEIVRSVK